MSDITNMSIQAATAQRREKKLLGDREQLGKLVREIWIECTREQPDPKPSHLIPWDELDEWNKEVDRRIGVGIVMAAMTTGIYQQTMMEEYRSGAQQVIDIVKRAVELQLPLDQLLTALNVFAAQLEAWFIADEPGNPPTGYVALGEIHAEARKGIKRESDEHKANGR